MPPSINKKTGEQIPLGLPRGGDKGQHPNAFNSMTLQLGPLLPNGGWGHRGAAAGLLRVVSGLQPRSTTLKEAPAGGPWRTAVAGSFGSSEAQPPVLI